MTIKKIKSRTASFLVILAAYSVAFTAGFLVYKLSSGLHVLVSTLLADTAATLVIWGTGLLFANSSIYDPYWSVAPLAIISLWIAEKGVALSLIDILFITAVLIWAIRLTVNWAIRWKGLQHQDWRYTMLKEKTPGLWFFTNLFGINLIPTIIVFTALIPVYFGIGSGKPPNIITGFGFAVCIYAVLIQAISDIQMDLFRKNRANKNKYIDRGLWRYSRHPNYLGEISFWWGIWLIQMGVEPRWWPTVIGAMLVTFLFVFISIPLMERHILSSKPSYRLYQRQVSALKFLPRKKMESQPSDIEVENS